MDAENYLKTYVAPSRISSVLKWIFGAGALIFLVVGMLFVPKDKKIEAQLFNPVYSGEGSYVYMNIAAVSDWIYQYDDDIYYAAIDVDNYYYNVKLTKAQYSEMQQQKENWTLDEIPAGTECYKVYGVARNVSSDLKDAFVQVFGINAADYDAYFGDMYLDATTTPAVENKAMWFMFAFMSAMFAFICFSLERAPKSNFKKCFARLEERGLSDKAAAELSSGIYETFGKDAARASQNFLYCKKTGVVLSFDDIVWCYQRVQRVYFVRVWSALIVNTLFLKDVAGVVFEFKKGDESVLELIQKIASKNPSVMVGFTPECRQKYNSIYKENKNRSKL